MIVILGGLVVHAARHEEHGIGADEFGVTQRRFHILHGPSAHRGVRIGMANLPVRGVDDSLDGEAGLSARVKGFLFIDAVRAVEFHTVVAEFLEQLEFVERRAFVPDYAPLERFVDVPANLEVVRRGGDWRLRGGGKS